MKFVPKFQTPAGTIDTTDYTSAIQSYISQHRGLSEDSLKLLYGDINTPLTLENASVYWDGTKWVAINRKASEYEKTGEGTDAEPKVPDVWTDWIPHTAGLITDLVASTNNYREAAKSVAPLKSAYKENARVTSGYLLLQLYAKRASDIRALANENLTSDPTKNANIKLKYELEAQKMLDNASLIGEQNLLQSLNKAQTVANNNLERSVKTANENQAALLANLLYIRDAKQKLNNEQATAMKTFGTNMYKDATSFVQAMKTNAAYKKARQNQAEYAQKMQQKHSDFNTVWKDPATSQYYKDFEKYIKTPDVLSQITGEIPNSNTPEYNLWLRNLWDTSDLAESYRKQFSEGYQRAYDALQDELWTLKSKYDFADLDRNYYEIGSLIGPTLTISRTVPTARRIVTTYQAKGGKAERFIDYAKVALKEMEYSRRQATEASKNNTRVLNQRLERISKELLLLLKEIFR